MNYNLVEILLVEDNPDDAELTIRELTKHNMAGNLVHVKDGEEALEFIFATGKYKNIRDVAHLPRLMLLDIQMPKVNGIEQNYLSSFSACNFETDQTRFTN